MDRNNMRHSYSSNGGSRQGHHMNSLNGKSRPSGGLNRLSPPAELPTNNHINPHNDLINYIYESWDKINREVEHGGRVDIYEGSRHLPHFDLESWWEQRRLQPLKRNSYNS